MRPCALEKGIHVECNARQVTGILQQCNSGKKMAMGGNMTDITHASVR